MAAHAARARASQRRDTIRSFLISRPLLSQRHHSTGPPSLSRYDNRYEQTSEQIIFSTDHKMAARMRGLGLIYSSESTLGTLVIENISRTIPRLPRVDLSVTSDISRVSEVKIWRGDLLLWGE